MNVDKIELKGDGLKMGMENPLEMAKLTMSLSQVVVKYVEDRILSGSYKSGDRVNEYFISRELNISRAPIREAIKELSMTGILDYSPRKGSAVAGFSKEDVDEIFDIRISLEKDIMKIIKEHDLLNSENISMLMGKAENMFMMATENADETKKIYTLNKLDLDFHAYIWNLANSPRRAKLLKSMFMQLLIAMSKNPSTLGKIEEKSKEHKELVQVLQNGSVQEVQLTLEEHINHYRNELFNTGFENTIDTNSV